MAVFREWSIDDGDQPCDNNNASTSSSSNETQENDPVAGKTLRDQIQAIKCRLTERLPLENHATLT